MVKHAKINFLKNRDKRVVKLQNKDNLAILKKIKKLHISTRNKCLSLCVRERETESNNSKWHGERSCHHGSWCVKDGGER